MPQNPKVVALRSTALFSDLGQNLGQVLGRSAFTKQKECPRKTRPCLKNRKVWSKSTELQWRQGKRRPRRGVRLVVSGSNSAEPLDFQEEILNQMSFLVQIPVYWPGIRHVALGWNHVTNAMLWDIFPNGLGTISLDCQHITSAESNVFNQHYGMNISLSVSAERRSFTGMSSPSTMVWIFVFRHPMVRQTSLSSVFPSPFANWIYIFFQVA